MARRLTDKGVERLKARRRPYTVFDSGATGLGVRVRPTGKRVWVLNLTFPGRAGQSRRVLGVFHPEAFGVVAARAKAREWYALVKDGRDPAVEAEQARVEEERARLAEAAKQQNTFAAFAESYIAERTNRRAKSDGQEIRRTLIRAWGERPIASITPDDVETVIEGIKARSAYEAKAAWQHCASIFKLARHKRLITASPVASLDKKIVFRNARIEHRQRVLDADELFALWRATGRVGYPAGPFYRLLLLTGMRKNELAQGLWTELHPEMRRLIREAVKAGQPVNWAAVPATVKTFTVPRERFKSDAEHVVPLVDDACAIIESLPRTGAFLFSLDGEKPVWLGTKHKNRLDDGMLRTLRALARRRGDDPASVKLPPWIGHDLRRVVRSNLSALGIPDHIGEMVIGHGRKGLQRVYDQHRYADEIRAALEAWAARLRAIVSPPAPPPAADGKVVALRPKRQRRG